MAELNFNGEKGQEGELLRLPTDTVMSHEVSEEFSLPDYVPEIRRLLHTRAGVLPESKYVGDDGTNSRVDFGGTVTYLLIYADDEGKLCSLPLTSSYEASASLVGKPNNVSIDTWVDTVTPRVNAPRRITIKSRLKSRIQGWESVNEAEKIENKSTADELFIERDVTELKTVSIKPISLEGVKISDRLDMQGIQSPRPIWCDAVAVIKDVRAQNNSVSVRGEAKIKCICEANGEMVALTKSVPIAEEISTQGATLGDMAWVRARCVSLAISNEQSDDNSQMFFDLDCELEGELLRNTDSRITRDCYSTKYETEESYKTVDVYSVAKAQNSSFTISEGVKRKNKEMARIIDVLWDPVCEKTEFKGDKTLVNGKLNLTVIGEGEENENGIAEYLSESYEMPFKYACDVGSLSEPISKASASILDVRAELDGEKIHISAEVYIAMSVIDRAKIQALNTSVLKKDKEIKKDAGCVRVYFPKEGDTLWEIAKKYHVTMQALREQNSLGDGDVEGIKNLII